MSKIGFIGLGLMGGSLAKAFRKLDTIEYIVAYDKNIDSLKKAKEDKVIDTYTDNIDDNFQDLDFIFICTPVNSIYPYAKELTKYIKEDCIITDIGSTKEKNVKQIDTLGIHFVGGHPMVGKEKIGYEYSCSDLYENAYYLLAITQNTQLEDLEKLKKLIVDIKAKPFEIPLEKHDFCVAAISHVPHIVATSLITLVSRLDDSEETLKTIAAGGLKDTTRIASSSPDMWINICLQNKDEILKILEKYEDIINEFKKNIDNEEALRKYFTTAKEYRDSMM